MRHVAQPLGQRQAEAGLPRMRALRLGYPAGGVRGRASRAPSEVASSRSESCVPGSTPTEKGTPESRVRRPHPEQAGQLRCHPWPGRQVLSLPYLTHCQKDGFSLTQRLTMCW